MENYSLYNKFLCYSSKIKLPINYETFKNPKKLEKFHISNVGTILSSHKNKLEEYPWLHKYSHLIYFNRILFFTYVTTNELQKGPLEILSKDGSKIIRL